MDKQILPARPTEFWYGKPGNIDRLFYGVFEGGGAKGVAYIGALRAMVEKKCWFRSVAGASAGAITAALVAAGLSPEEIEEATGSAFEHLQTGMWSGMFRLRKTTGYFSPEGLRTWLNELLKKQVAKTGVALDNEATITFRELWKATGIELNIVAADLSLKSQIIFSHNETPECGVADAVIASSSIPFAFPSCVLQVPEDNDTDKLIHHHTIVDGGVWSNFPMFIFEDNAFRQSYQREPETIESRDILGFILKESDEPVPAKGEDIKFVEAVPASEFNPREWRDVKLSEEGERLALASKIGIGLLSPFYVLGRIVEGNSGMERGRWPTPKPRVVNYLVHSVSGLLGGIYPPFFGIVAFVLVTVGAWEVTSGLVAGQIKAGIPSVSDLFGRIVLLALTVLIIAVAVLLPFVTLLAVAANYILLRASRRLVYGLVTTYVAGSGAPAWVEKKTNVVPLPIPSTVKTLSFKMGRNQRTDLIESARQATLAKLETVLKEDKSAA